MRILRTLPHPQTRRDLRGLRSAIDAPPRIAVASPTGQRNQWIVRRLSAPAFAPAAVPPNQSAGMPLCTSPATA
jgi:hypothetical protein